jgi:GH15 family glucan-1,4-alpha-glucosidase
MGAGGAGRDRDVSAPISDYAMISNCRVSALVSREGSIDWLCLPHPHSPSIFGAILDDQRGGRWSLRPARVRSIERRYLGRSNVVETTFDCDGGALRITDLLHVGPHAGRGPELAPDSGLDRRIECLEGNVDVTVEMTPRPDYARRPARARAKGEFGIRIEAGTQSFVLRSDLVLRIDDRGCRIHGQQRLGAGEVYWMALGHTARGPEVAPMLGARAEARLRGTLDWWEAWSGACDLPAVAPDCVMRSAITLRSMVYPPSGAVIAAPTTSLPERIGGERNWDYRYCWIRDASFTMRALLRLGARAEAQTFLSWLLYATRLTWPRLQVLYDVYGRTRMVERELSHLAGHRDSRPVRIGNAARDQLQLDPYGALLDAAWQYHELDGPLSARAGRMLRGFVNTTCRLWRQPDAGIWEIRAGARHHTLSKAMCWVAMDRGLRLARAGVMSIDEGRIRAEMDEVRRVVENEGFNRDVGAYTGALGGESVDASLLLLSIYGFEDPDSARMRSTVDRIYERLGVDGALYRYRGVDDGVSGSEGPFGICGFWGVEALALAGRTAEARGNLDKLLRHANDLGLFAEEVDATDGDALGNFPQALTHVGLINAACALDRARRPEPAPPAQKKGV